MPKPPDPSPEAAALFKKYLSDAPVPAPQIVDRLETYLQFVAKVSEVNASVDHALAGRIAGTIEQLLGVVAPEKFKYVQAAARYFTEDEDAEGDLVSADGFDDDIAVLNAVCHHLGRDDLQIA